MRYFFHIQDARGLIREEEGTELVNIAAAHCEALASARDLVLEDIRRGVPLDARWIEIADGQGRVFELVPVLDVVA